MKKIVELYEDREERIVPKFAFWPKYLSLDRKKHVRVWLERYMCKQCYREENLLWRWEYKGIVDTIPPNGKW